MASWIFSIALISGLLLDASLVLTLLSPRHRVWPPPEGRRSGGFWFTWTLTVVGVLGILTLGILDWGARPWPGWIRFGLGPLLMAAGTAFALWGVRTLSVHAALGLGGELVTGGPYRFSRNPQYVGDIALLIGYGLLTASPRTLLLTLVGALWFVLAPFTEEPWLRERFGPAYDAYAARVPRFLSLRSLRPPRDLTPPPPGPESSG